MFLTPRAAASQEVFPEVYEGFERWKGNEQSDAYNFVTVYLEPTNLSSRWYFLKPVQGLLPYQVTTTAYQRALDRALGKVKGIRIVANPPEPPAEATIPASIPTEDTGKVADVLPLPLALPSPSVSAPSTRQLIKPRRSAQRVSSQRCGNAYETAF